MLPTGMSSRLTDRVVHAAWFIFFVGLLTSGARASSPAGQIPSQRFDHYSELARMETVIDRMYRTSEQRIYIGGWSGGSRVALGLALAYPDLFRSLARALDVLDGPR